MTVGSSEKLVAGHVYLVPADHHVVITDHTVEARGARGGRPSPSIDRLLATAADTYGERLIAVVRVATELTASQRARLTAALSATYGHDIHLNVVIDPAVVGGMSVQIGDEFIDGSVASRLAQVRRRLAA